MSFYFSAKNKGYIRVKDGENAGTIHEFQFNPSQFSHSKSANWSEAIAPGMAYPLLQWVRGNTRNFNLELFMWDKPNEGLIESARGFILDLLPPDYNDDSYERPPIFTVVYGDFIKDCVAESYDMVIEEWDTFGGITQARFTLTCKQVKE